MTQKFYAPDNIPLYFFYFAWKKARHFVTQQGFYDPIEIKEFELELEKNLVELKESFASLEYEMASPIIYGFPKGLKNGELALRPMAKVRFRDQVAWATVVLVLGEWFDTENTTDDNFKWMVDWSCNNRLRRKYYPKILEDNIHYERLMINYIHNELYESFQRSLRLQRKKQEEAFKKILSSRTVAYYGKADIMKFYPSLRLDIISKVLLERLRELSLLNVCTQKDVHKWIKLLDNMLEFESNVSHLTRPERKAIGINHKAEKELLAVSLPIGLISSGFLANCTLTHHLDKHMDEYILSKSTESKLTFITRYTDDITLISSDENVIYEGFSRIQDLLGNIGLKLSADKTVPLIKENLIVSMTQEFPDLTETQVENLVDTVYADHLRCPRVGKYDTLPCSTSLIDKLSQLGDQQVKAMNEEELTNYISEVLDLLNTGFAEEEIRDDTKTSFAAWRLRKSVNDARYRDLRIKSYVSETLMRAFMKYPYKLSLVSCYILHIMESMGDDEASSIKLLIDVLKNSKKTKDAKLPGYYGSYIRTHVMFTIADYWSKIPEKSRPKLKKAIENQVNNWYQSTSPCWHEEYAVYWLCSSLNIQEIKLPYRSELSFVARVRQLYELKNYHVFAGSDPVLIATICDTWRRTRPKVLDSEKYEDTILDEEGQWIQWVWKKIEKWKWGTRGNERVWAELSRGRERYIPTFGFTKLIKLCEEQLINFFSDELFEIDELLPKFNGLIEVLNQAITIWVSRIDQNFNKRFTRAIQQVSDDSRVKKYLESRLRNLDLILNTYLPRKSNLIPEGFDQLREKAIPLQDWVEIIINPIWEIVKRKIPNVLLPLTEAEITSLLVHVGRYIKKTLRDGSEIDRFLLDIFTMASLNRISFSIENWENWRRDPINCKFEFAQNNIVFSESELSAWYYTKISFVDEDHLLSHAYSILLLKLISNKVINSGTTGVRRLRGWRKIGDIISQAGFPSTAIAELIAGELNYQRQFYKNISSNDIPLFPLEKTPVKNFEEYITRLEKHLNKLQERMFIGSTGLREIIYIDLDKLTE